MRRRRKGVPIGRPKMDKVAMKRLLGYLKDYKLRVILVLVCILLSAVSAGIFSPVHQSTGIRETTSPYILISAVSSSITAMLYALTGVSIICSNATQFNLPYYRISYNRLYIVLERLRPLRLLSVCLPQPLIFA